MFCKPPCPDMNDHLDDRLDDVSPAPATSDVPAGRDDHDSRGRHAFGRLTTPGTTGPVQRLPSAVARTGQALAD